MVKVSVIITTYNNENDIKRAIDSVIQQTYENWELIIVNDGSTDKTEEVVLSYNDLLKDKLHYYCIKHSGLAVARNVGMNEAHGDYFMFLDADDYLDINLLNMQKDNLEKKIDIIKYKMQKVDISGNEICKLEGPVFEIMNGEDAFNILYAQDNLFGSACVYLYRKEYILSSGYKFLDGTYHEDFGFVPLVIANADSVISTNMYGYFYVQSENSIMRNNNHEIILKKMDDSLIHYDNLLSNLVSAKVKRKTKENLKIFYTNAILQKIKELSVEDRRKYIQEFKNRKMAKNIKIRNVKQFIKRIVLETNVEWYLNNKG